MLPFIGPEFLAHLFDGLPNRERRGAPLAPRLPGHALDNPRFLLKVRLTVIEITQPEKVERRNRMTTVG
jgi:hypothetical protein